MTSPTGTTTPHAPGCNCATCMAVLAESVFAAVDANYDTEAGR